MGKKKKAKRLDLTFAIKGTNILITGDASREPDGVLELVYSGNETDAEKVTVTLVEIDEDETVDSKKTGKDAKLAKFVGSIANNIFTATSSEILTEKLPDSAPYIKVSIGGIEDPVKVKLPNVDSENGLFELGVMVTSGSSKYRSSWRAYARHYTVRPADGPVMAFITGAEDRSFFTAAGKYWKQHADAVLVKEGMSLEEIVSFLLKHRESYGDYGEINIVTHGNRLSAILRIVKGGGRELRLKTLYRTLGIEGEEAEDDAAKQVQEANAEKFNHTAAELGLGEKSRIVFRACNIGHRPDVLKAVREHIFADACTVYAPKYVQGYSDGDLITRRRVAPFEYLEEDLQRHVPGRVSPPRRPRSDPDGTSQEEMMEPIFAAAHPNLSFDDEKDSYKAKISSTKPGHATYTLSGGESWFYDFVSDANKTDAQLASDMQDGFDAERVEDTEYTRWEQWRWGPIKRKDMTRKVGKKVEVVTTENILVQVKGKKAFPHRAVVSPGGSLPLGSDSELGKVEDAGMAPSGVSLPGKGIAETHATISTSGAPDVAIEAEPDQTFSVKGKRADSWTGTAPMSFAIRPYKIALRSERQRVAVARLTRTLVHWRRALREDKPDVPYGEERPLIIRDVTDGDYYGSSDDPVPSDEELAELFE